MFSSHGFLGWVRNVRKTRDESVTAPTRWDVDEPQVPVDPLSMETLARRPQQADEVHKGGGEKMGFPVFSWQVFWGSNFLNSPETNGDNGKINGKSHHFYIDIVF